MEMKRTDRSTIKRSIRKELLRNGIRRASLFGSIIDPEEFSDQSDIDIMIEPTDQMSLIDLARMKRILEEEMGMKVDIITYDSIDRRYRKRFMDNSEELI